MFVGGLSNKGLVREINQDSMYIPRENCAPLFIVADGMGGHKAGEVASKLSVDIIRKEISHKALNITDLEELASLIKGAIELANKEVYEYSLKHDDCKGMGTTLTLAYIFNDHLIVGHVGDSRAYYIRDNKLTRITEDHSLVNELIKTGEITLEEALSHPRRNVILRALGTSEDIEVDINKVKIKKDDIFIICSDGLTNMVDEKRVKEIFNKEKNMEYACKLAIEAAIHNGGKDNITVIGIRF